MSEQSSSSEYLLSVSNWRQEESGRRQRLQRLPENTVNVFKNGTSRTGYVGNGISTGLWTLPNGLKVSEFCQSMLATRPMSALDEQQRQLPQKSTGVSPTVSSNTSNDTRRPVSPSLLSPTKIESTPTSEKSGRKKRSKNLPNWTAAVGNLQTPNEPPGNVENIKNSQESIRNVHGKETDSGEKMPGLSAICWKKKDYDDFIATLCSERNTINGDSPSNVEQLNKQQEKSSVIVNNKSKIKRTDFKLLASNDSTKGDNNQSEFDCPKIASRAGSKVKSFSNSLKRRQLLNGKDTRCEAENSSKPEQDPISKTNKPIADEQSSEALDFVLDSTVVTTDSEQQELSSSKASCDRQSPDDNENEPPNSGRTTATNRHRQAMLDFISTVMTSKRARKGRPVSGTDQDLQSKRVSLSGKILDRSTPPTVNATENSKWQNHVQSSIAKSAEIGEDDEKHLLHQSRISYVKVPTNDELETNSSSNSLETYRDCNLSTQRSSDAETREINFRPANDNSDCSSGLTNDLEENDLVDSGALKCPEKFHSDATVKPRDHTKPSSEAYVSNHYNGRIVDQLNYLAPSDVIDEANSSGGSERLQGGDNYSCSDFSLPSGCDAENCDETSARGENDLSTCGEGLQVAGSEHGMHESFNVLGTDGMVELDYTCPDVADNQSTMTSLGDVIRHDSSRQLMVDAEDLLEAVDIGSSLFPCSFVDAFSVPRDNATQCQSGLNVDVPLWNKWNIIISNGSPEIIAVKDTTAFCGTFEDRGLSESLTSCCSHNEPVLTNGTYTDLRNDFPTENKPSLELGIECHTLPTPDKNERRSMLYDDMLLSLSMHDEAAKSPAILEAFESMFQLSVKDVEPCTENEWIKLHETEMSSDNSLIKITRDSFANKIIIEFEPSTADSSLLTCAVDTGLPVCEKNGAQNDSPTVENGQNEPVAALDQRVTSRITTSRGVASPHRCEVCEDDDSCIHGTIQMSVPTFDDNDANNAEPCAKTGALATFQRTASFDDSNGVEWDSSHQLLATSNDKPELDLTLFGNTETTSKPEQTSAGMDNQCMDSCPSIGQLMADPDVMTTSACAAHSMGGLDSGTECKFDNEPLDVHRIQIPVYPDYSINQTVVPPEVLQFAADDELATDYLPKRVLELNFIDSDPEEHSRVGAEWKTTATALDDSGVDDENTSSSSLASESEDFGENIGDVCSENWCSGNKTTCPCTFHNQLREGSSMCCSVTEIMSEDTLSVAIAKLSTANVTQTKGSSCKCSIICKAVESIDEQLNNSEQSIPNDIQAHAGRTLQPRSKCDEEETNHKFSEFIRVENTCADESSSVADDYKNLALLSSENFHAVGSTPSKSRATAGNSTKNSENNGQSRQHLRPGLDDLSTSDHHVIADASTFDLSTREALMCRGKERLLKTDRKHCRHQRRLELRERLVKITLVVSEVISIFPAKSRNLSTDQCSRVSRDPAEEVQDKDGGSRVSRRPTEVVEYIEGGNRTKWNDLKQVFLDSRCDAPTLANISPTETMNYVVTDDDVISVSTDSSDYLTPPEDLPHAAEIQDLVVEEFYDVSSAESSVGALPVTEAIIFEQIVPYITLNCCETDDVTCQSTPICAPLSSYAEICPPEASMHNIAFWQELESETVPVRFESSCFDFPDHMVTAFGDTGGESPDETHIVEFSDVIIHEYAEVVSYFTDFVFIPVDRLESTENFNGNELALVPLMPTTSGVQNIPSSDRVNVSLRLMTAAVQELAMVPYPATSLSAMSSQPEIVAVLPRPPMTWTWSSSLTSGTEVGLEVVSSALRHIPFVSECYDTSQTPKTERFRLVASTLVSR